MECHEKKWLGKVGAWRWDFESMEGERKIRTSSSLPQTFFFSPVAAESTSESVVCNVKLKFRVKY